MDFSFGASALPQQKQQQQGAGGMDPDFLKFLEMYMNQKQQPPPDPMAAAQADVTRLTALRNDPQGDANRGYMPGVDNAQSPFSNGFFQSGASSLSPEAQMATQGRSAMNQWAQMGQVPGVDAGGLQSLMAQRTPIPTNSMLPDATTSDPFFQRRMQQMFGERTDLPMDLQGQYQGMMEPLPQGVIMGDGVTNYSRSKKKSGQKSMPKASGSPLSGFTFGA